MLNQGIPIDPNQPTQREVAEHNMKVTKANLACKLAGELCGNPACFGMPAIELAMYSIEVAETLIEKYTLMPPMGGLTS